jgi:signal transduction histidine kinase
MAAVDGFEIDPAAGTCSAAAARKEQVITHDIFTDPHWADYRELASRHGLRAGWATPILSSAGGVLGTFALYWTEPRSPKPHHLEIINQIARLVAFAIERKQAAEALQASEKLARGQAEALTRALDALAMETNPDRVLEHVLRTVTAQLDAHSSSVWLRDEATGLMVFEFALEHGKFKTKTETALAAVSPSLPVRAIIPWPEVFRTGKPSVLEDIREGPDFPWRAHVLAQGIVTILVVPMLIAGNVEGVIGVRFAQKRTFRAEELELAQALANQAMLAIQLARLSAQSRQTAIIEERNRMARDIHDTLAQGFTGVILHLEAAEEAISRERADVVSGHLRGAGEIARDGLREARRSVQALRPQALEERSLAEALKDMIEKLTARTAIRAELTLQGEAKELPPEWEANILRLGQEALTNVLRHARAGEVEVLLVFRDREVRLNLRDNGCGFDPAGKYAGFGLRGMAERVENMGGHLSILSANGAGTTISVVLPLPASIESEEP